MVSPSEVNITNFAKKKFNSPEIGNPPLQPSCLGERQGSKTGEEYTKLQVRCSFKYHHRRVEDGYTGAIDIYLRT